MLLPAVMDSLTTLWLRMSKHVFMRCLRRHCSVDCAVYWVSEIRICGQFHLKLSVHWSTVGTSRRFVIQVLNWWNQKLTARPTAVEGSRDLCFVVITQSKWFAVKWTDWSVIGFTLENSKPRQVRQEHNAPALDCPLIKTNACFKGTLGSGQSFAISRLCHSRIDLL